MQQTTLGRQMSTTICDPAIHTCRERTMRDLAIKSVNSRYSHFKDELDFEDDFVLYTLSRLPGDLGSIDQINEVLTSHRNADQMEIIVKWMDTPIPGSYITGVRFRISAHYNKV